MSDGLIKISFDYGMDLGLIAEKWILNKFNAIKIIRTLHSVFKT